MIVADNYNLKEDITTLTLLPYGKIDIPGKWTKTTYNQTSKQHFFIDKDSTSIAVTKNLQEKYPFYSGTMTDGQFSENFFEWEKEFYEKQGFKIDKKMSGDNFVIWTANENNANTTFLYGAKNKFAYNFAIYTDNWSDEQQVEFLINLFNNN